MSKKDKTIKILEAENSRLRAKIGQMQSIIDIQKEVISCYDQIGINEAALKAAKNFDDIIEPYFCRYESEKEEQWKN